MSTLRLMTRQGFEQELPGVTLISIDGVPMDQLLTPSSVENQEIIESLAARIQVLELAVTQQQDQHDKVMIALDKLRETVHILADISKSHANTIESLAT